MSDLLIIFCFKMPWMASFGLEKSTGWYHFCGGAIISEYAVISAAHCFFSKRDKYRDGTKIRLGDQNLTDATDNVLARTYDVNTVIRHRKYKGRRSQHDLAIAYTKTPIQFNQRTRPVTLPSRANNATGTRYQNVDVLFGGWGYFDSTLTTSDALRETNFTVLSSANCTSLYGRIRGMNNLTFCAGNEVIY